MDIFYHDYYAFSGLIYDANDYDNIGVTNQLLIEYAHNLNQIELNSTIQVIYPKIKPEWVISAQTLQEFPSMDNDKTLRAQALYHQLFRKRRNHHDPKSFI